jgi:hypothetical protein
MSSTLQIGDIVTMVEIYHVRGASIGAIEAITEQGWYRVFWQEDEIQITPAFRTYQAHELKLYEP